MLTRVMFPAITATLHSSRPAAVQPRARNASSAQTAGPRCESPAPGSVPAAAMYGTEPTTVAAAVAGTAPSSWLSGRSTIV
jgi:hypothetical protein